MDFNRHRESHTEDPMKQSLANLMRAIRIGDIRSVRDCLASHTVDVNAVDEFDYTPLILASLCGHYEIVEFLLESGVRCERDTFQGERAIYIALNDRIRNLLIKHDYSISIDSRQPFAALISSLLIKDSGGSSVPGIFLPRPSGDVTLNIPEPEPKELATHAFVLAARSPFFKEILYQTVSQDSIIYLPSGFSLALTKKLVQYFYLVDIEESFSEIELQRIVDMNILPSSMDYEYIVSTTPEIQRGATSIEAAQRDFLRLWDEDLSKPLRLPRDKAEAFSLDMMDARILSLRPDVILRIEPPSDEASYFYGVHKAILQSDFINTAIQFKERFQTSDSQQGLPKMVSIEASNEIMKAILRWTYTDNLEIGLELALDLLLTADMLLSERLKSKACLLIITQDRDELLTGELGYSVFDVARAGWLTRTSSKLDPFCAKFLASRLEHCLDSETAVGAEFENLVKDSAARIEKREATDTIELIDDIRYYLDERFRMRFDDLATSMFSETGDTISSVADIERSDPSGELLRTSGKEYDRLVTEIDALLGKLELDA